MASSDSEDFESADEDVSISLPETSESVANPKVDSGPQETPKHQNLNEDRQLIAPLKEDVSGSGDELTTTESKTSDALLRPEHNESVEKGKVVQPINRKQGQHKQREQKVNVKPKKLGTKITSEVKALQAAKILPNPIQPNEFVDETQVNVAKNQSQPLLGLVQAEKVKSIATRPSTVTSDNLTSKPDFDLEEDTHISRPKPTISSDVDPYEKFKGYSMPPRMEQCWEEGVDNHTLYGIGSQSSKGEVQRTDEQSVAPVLDKLVQAADRVQSNSSWGGWGNWGVTSLLSTATEGVSTITSHVSSVLESGIGAPNPEELARISQQEEQKYEAEATKTDEVAAEEPTGLFNFGQLMTSVSKLVESTGNKVISGGLDTLETIGKKTMEVLQEGDPGFKKKRAMFSESTVLSQVLREAKEQAEVQDKVAESQQDLRSIHFETLFDEYQGLVHLEALEMLSKQCDLKLQSLLLASIGPVLTQLQENLQKIKESCHLPDEQDITEEENEPSDWWKELAVAEEKLTVPVAADKFSKIWNETQEWLKESTEMVEEYNARAIHKKAISTLAQLTATSMEQFHKGAELLMVKDKRDATAEAKALKQVTSVLCSQVTTTATNFCERLNSCPEESPSDSVNALITNVFLEASNSSSYIQEAFQLLVPVLQVGVSS